MFSHFSTVILVLFSYGSVLGFFGGGGLGMGGGGNMPMDMSAGGQQQPFGGPQFGQMGQQPMMPQANPMGQGQGGPQQMNPFGGGQMR
ncbi:hypothetical protein niasHS_015902 [Heterodera schachtii]|uniref:Uncharacterized protein n=1 Tax=Heterodera schachtii TaxID=97005 RepID=A0ABD2I0M0_HETSC